MNETRTSLSIPNRTARWLWLHSQGLAAAPTGPSNSDTTASIIESLGLLQQDPIRVVARAHDHILWSRRNQFRPSQLETLMHKKREVFEHFSHDACLLPMKFLPYWRRQFVRRAAQYERPGWSKNLLSNDESELLLAEIADRGPLASKDFREHFEQKPRSGEIWSKPAHKTTLDYLWLKGTLAVSHRRKFIKYYDLSSRVYPEHLLSVTKAEQEQVDWLCENALQRLGFATHGEIMRFWEACDLAEVKEWCDKNNANHLMLSVEGMNGEHSAALGYPALETLINNPPEPTKRLRILNPFDPAIRDRNRLKRLFGFDYRIEMYTPPTQRQYGYYVYPLLEFDRIVGRLEVRHDREVNRLVADNLWLEPKCKLGKGRLQLLEAELDRMRKFCGAEHCDLNFVLTPA